VKGSALPTTNLEKLSKPPQPTFSNDILWDLAMMLEGRKGIIHVHPDEFKAAESPVTIASKYLAYALRHSYRLAFAEKNG
jgi:hypothetical protein